MNEKIEIIATGKNIVGYGTRSIQGTIEELFKNAKDEIIIAVYSITGNLVDLYKILSDCASGGIKISFIINRLIEKDTKIIKILRKLSEKYNHVSIYNFTDESNGDLHLKTIIVDRRKAIIGSANFSWKGMIQNHELGVLIEGKYAEKVGRLIENVIDASEKFA